VFISRLEDFHAGLAFRPNGPSAGIARRARHSMRVVLFSSALGIQRSIFDWQPGV
jgi:hypothetical protein